MTRTDYPWLLPSEMIDPRGPELPGDRGRARPRRTVRDWIIDTLMFLLAAAIGLIALEASEKAGNSENIVLVDMIVGVLACCALWTRRRWPVGLALVLGAVSAVAPVSGGAAVVALFCVAVHRPFRVVAAVGGLSLVAGCLQTVIRPDPSTSLTAGLIATVVLILMVTGWGMLVRARRQLVVALRERATRAEAEAELRAEQAQRLAREAIAREMHDVLAHRLTLLSVHAGALEFRPDAPAPEVARAAGVIRDSAHEALQDLRMIIGVLRAPGDEGDRPQPTLVTLDALVAESREAGMKVTLDSRIDDPAAVPAATGRTAYRIAQEGLTNARKHAPGTEATVEVSGGPGDGLTVQVRNAAPPGEVPRVPGSGQGLIGLTERALLAGGRFEHGATGDGGFAVRAWLPWAA
ncbi:histidine kinase [Streptomyces scopuliridis]|uniref:Histidine kinase n=1 Tax=Streptomyces scopuliridis TaxID=452529 RepID=A0ACD4ZEQ2_9ACTN|nr:histidine kinase [Streptomyces scopuliridis]WSB32710.1 histidine kinase [Streptomyces scopuliridis]WSB96962.1 histidine kinase [Streptomyces scopuliridis]WSC09334.1 histidine kinase [Streptomyces scopuliridis]